MESYDKCLKLYKNKKIITNDEELKNAKIHWKIGRAY